MTSKSNCGTITNNTLNNVLSNHETQNIFENNRIISLNVTSDNISIDHDLIFARPTPNDHFDCTNNIPSYTDESIYTLSIFDFPLENLPSDHTCSTDIRISPSEMCITILKLYNHPTSGVLSQTWINVDTNTILYETEVYNIPNPDPNWETWYSYIWSYIGHFLNEITSPGNYQCITYTTWGNATIDFKVVCADIIPKYKCDNNICIRDDINGTYDEPTCNNECIESKTNKFPIMMLGLAALGLMIIAKPSKQTRKTKKLKSSELINKSESTKLTRTPKSSKLMKTSKSSNLIRTPKSSKPLKTSKTTKLTETTKSSKPLKIAKSSKTLDTSEVLKSSGISKKAKSTKNR